MQSFAQQVYEPGLDLCGGVLVEASAGTGKTFNIQNAYLRLVVADGLNVQNILVVTFTEAATQELRTRLRQILTWCVRYLVAGAAGVAPETAARLEKLLALPLADTKDGVSAHDIRLARVRRALMDFDSAAIFTIHGFCNRVLERYAFECGHDPEAELIPDAGEILTAVCRDWWRRQTYGTARDIGKVPFATLKELVTLAGQAARRPEARLLPAQDPGTAAGAAVAFQALLLRLLQDPRGLHATNSGTRALRKSLLAFQQKANSGVIPLPELGALAGPFVRLGKDASGWADKPDARKGNLTTEARFPGAVEAAQQLSEAILAAQNAAVREILAQLDGTVRDRGAITYDAMLSRVRDALCDTQLGPRLREVLQQEFRAALIDEFQDTDPVQYETFRRLFQEPLLPLLLVGDPKQAIYGFRSGDIFTYYRARSSDPIKTRIHSLETNFRSEPGMVAAVNELFQDGADDHAFLNSQISYAPIRANGVDAAKQLAPADPRPLKLWAYAHDGSKMPGKDTPLARQIVADVADEIVRLLSGRPPHTLGGKPVRPSDIAILVHTHREAARFQEELIRRGVNAVRQATDNVFDMPEARGLALIMQAMLEPGSARAIRSALCSGLIPCTRAAVRAYNSPEGAPPAAGTAGEGVPQRLEEWCELFRAAGACWRRRSFVEAFALLATRLDLQAHLARNTPENPEEQLAALQQLVELAHRAAVAARRSPVSLYRWFVRQLTAEHRDEDDAHKVRPASDDAAVRIMTVFKAKGLEFPIVFVPTLWRWEAKARKLDEQYAAYHDAQFDMVLDLRPEGDEQACRESLEEGLRLVYVAVTRAVNRTYLCTVDLRAKGEAADRLETHPVRHLVTRWRQQDAGGEASCIGEQPRMLSGAGDQPERMPPATAVPAATLAPRERGAAVVDQSHGSASFTSLTRAGHDANRSDPADHDAVPESGAPAPAAARPGDIFLFPGSAQIGDCWHRIFETIDFQGDASQRAAAVDGLLDLDGICRGAGEEISRRKRRAVHDMVDRVLTAALPAEPAPFSLQQISPAQRRSELSFHFPLARARPARQTRLLAEILRRQWDGPARNEEFLEQLATLENPIPLGFMTGSIDLLFEHGGRFYIVDWKSNRLDGRPERFESAGVAQEMARHLYYLQYLIYTVAVDGYLRTALAGYDYDRHMGGVYYLFVRGVEGATGRGIFHDRPSAACIRALSRALMSGEGETP